LGKGVQRICLQLLAILCGLVLSVPAYATPAEEIIRAVAVHGVADISLARSGQFLKGFSAVALRVQPRDLPEYVIAAINLRPDLAPRAVAVAVKAAAKNWEAKPEALCALIARIVTAAIAAEPDAAVAIAKAGASASPRLRQCIVAAAIAAAPQAKAAIMEAATTKTQPFAFLTFSASDTSGFSFSPATLNPANISDPGDDDRVNSPEQPPSH
jgi:hypothetical protein